MSNKLTVEMIRKWYEELIKRPDVVPIVDGEYVIIIPPNKKKGKRRKRK